MSVLPSAADAGVDTARPVLRVRDLEVRFAVKREGLFSKPAQLHAVDGVSFDVAPGRTLGLVGESGSGKSTTALAAARLIPARGGRVEIDGTDILTLEGETLRQHRRTVQFIFQDPYSSLNPRLRASEIVREPLDRLGDRCAGGAGTAGLGAVPRRGPAPRAAAAVPPPVLRRPAPAARYRPGAGLAAEARDLRRAGLGARRRGAGPDTQPAPAPAARARPHLPVHLPRSGVIQHMCNEVAVMYTGRIVEQARGCACSPIRCTVHEGAPVLGAVGGSEARLPLGANPHHRGSSEPHRPAARLPLRLALPDRRRALPQRDASARRSCRGPPSRLPSRGRGRSPWLRPPRLNVLAETGDRTRIRLRREVAYSIHRDAVPMRIVARTILMLRLTI